MGKFGKSSSSFKVWQSTEEVDGNRLRLRPLRRSVSDGDKKKNFRVKDNFRVCEDSGDKEIHKMPNFGASTSKDSSSIKTPENTKIPEIPNAPKKLRSKRLQKIDQRPKRLQFFESENETVNSIDSGLGVEVECEKHRYPTRSKFQKPEKKIEAKNVNENQKKKSKKNCDKENYCNAAKKSQRQTTNRKGLSKLSSNLEASKNFDTAKAANEKQPLKRQHSACESDDWKEHLRWLQPRRDVGIWIECCRKNCRKWRYTESYHDPVDVPKIWYCEMNVDKKFANCSVPQQEIPAEVDEELIANAYNAGSIVWARLNGYPWWPAMVDDCPYLLRYYEINEKSKIPHKYHVTFFSKEPETAWIPVKNIKPYASNPRNTFLKKTIYRGKDYSKELDIDCEMATKALPLSIFERLKRFSYISRISEESSERVSKKKREEAPPKNQTIRIRSRTINADADIDENRQNFSKFRKSKNSTKIATENSMNKSPIDSNENLQSENLQENLQNLQNENLQENLQNLQNENLQENLLNLQNENLQENLQNLQNENLQENLLNLQNENLQENLLNLQNENLQENLLNLQNENLLENLQNSQTENLQKNLQNSQNENLLEIFKNSQKENLLEIFKNSQTENLEKNLQNSQTENLQKNLQNSQKENLLENSLNIQKSSKAINKSKKNIELIRIDETDEEILEPTAGTSREENFPKRNRQKCKKTKNVSLVEEAIACGENSLKMLEILAGLDAIEKRGRERLEAENQNGNDRRVADKADNNFEKPMEVDNDNLPNSFSAEEFMPRRSKNFRIEEISPTRSNSHSSLDLVQSENIEKSFRVERESNFVNDRNSSIGFSSEEFDPRPSRNRNSFRSCNSEFEFRRRSRFGAKRHFSNPIIVTLE